MNWLNPDFLFASLIWGSIGWGYWIYGKRQSSMTAMLGGGAMFLVSSFVPSILWMSVICAGTMALVYLLARQGY